MTERINNDDGTYVIHGACYEITCSYTYTINYWKGTKQIGIIKFCIEMFWVLIYCILKLGT